MPVSVKFQELIDERIIRKLVANRYVDKVMVRFEAK
jgi:hypothetical protein